MGRPHSRGAGRGQRADPGPTDPRRRTWLHLNDPDSAIGRVAAQVSPAQLDEVRVLAFALREDVDRAAVRDVLRNRLLAPSPAEDRTGPHLVHEVADAIVEMLRADVPGLPAGP